MKAQFTKSLAKTSGGGHAWQRISGKLSETRIVLTTVVVLCLLDNHLLLSLSNNLLRDTRGFIVVKRSHVF